MNSTQLYPLTVALKTSAVLDALATENEPLSFDGLASAVAGQEYDVESDCAECCDQNKALVSYLSFLGVKDSTLEDMVMGTEDLSSELVLSLSHAFTAKYDDADMDSLCEEFSQTYTDVDMDDISPTRCKSGYKRKMTIHKGKPKWKCIRLFGKKRLSAKQKQALVKARRKSHTALANYSRKRSTHIGQRKGLY